MDVTAYYKGYHGDLNETFVVGEVDSTSKQLLKVTYEVRPCSDQGRVNKQESTSFSAEGGRHLHRPDWHKDGRLGSCTTLDMHNTSMLFARRPHAPFGCTLVTDYQPNSTCHHEGTHPRQTVTSHGLDHSAA